jgi:hypothetical protein
MSSTCNFVSTALYNRFSQHDAIQNLASGVVCLSYGKHLLCDPDSSPTPSLIRKIGRAAAGVTLLAGGLAALYYGLYYGGGRLVKASTDDLKSLFLFGQNPAPSTQEDPYEQAFKKYAQPFNNQTEVLYLGASAAADHNKILNPSYSFSMPLCLNEISKLKYKVIRHPLQICEEIQSAAKTGPVQDLVIGAHGNIRCMSLSPTSRFYVFDQLPTNCFDGLASTARIYLTSCSTGAYSLWGPNVAEWMSWLSGREVIAPSAPITGALGKCFINPENGRLDIKLRWRNYTASLNAEPIDRTTRFNTSTSWAETALFSVKMIAPTILGAMATWQSMRFGATVLQRSGAAAEWLVDRSAAPTKKLAERIGLYNPAAAQILYIATKGTSQILNATGNVTHQAMDKLIQRVSNLGSWVFGKSITAATTVAQTLYSKMGRS